MLYGKGDESCWPYCKLETQVYYSYSENVSVLKNFTCGTQGSTYLAPGVSIFQNIMYVFWENGTLFYYDVDNGKYIASVVCKCDRACMAGVTYYSSPVSTYLPPVIDSAGNAYVGIGNKYCSFDKTGKQRWEYTVPLNSWILSESAWDSTGTLYISGFTAQHESFIIAV
jgi:outer membrane protein assembly factor BamB